MSLPAAPRAAQKPHVHEKHGDHRDDPFFWMKNRDSQDVLEHLSAENTYADVILKPTEPLQKELFEEMKGRIKEDDATVPYRMRGYYYYVRYESGGEYPIYCRKKGDLDAAEEILLNVNEMAKDQSYYDLGAVKISPDNQMVAFSLDLQGRRKFDIHFKDLTTDTILDVVIPHTAGNFVWSDNEYLFYSHKNPETLRYESIFRFSIKSSLAEQVYFEKDETFDVFVQKSQTEDYVFMGCVNKVSTEVHFLKAKDPLGQWQVFEPRSRDHEYSIEHAGDDTFFVLTNFEASNFKVMSTTLKNTEKQSWKELIPHREDTLIESMEVFKNYVALDERFGGLSQIRIFDRRDGSLKRLEFQEKAYSVGLGANAEYDTETLRYHYDSPKTPPSTFDYSFESGQHTLLKQKEILGGFDRAAYKVEWVMVKARDGVLVPMSLLYHKDTKLDGSAPCLQYGYGSYGISMDPHFSSNILSLVDRGFVYAKAHIRGGSEMGRHWYEDGKFLKKMNTFYDFIDCTEHLISNKYTNPDKLVIMGGSAGGMLMGTVMNMRPELYKAAISVVPFVDVVTTMLDDSLPLTTGEYDEWGNPNDKEYYEYMLSYSPIDNVSAQSYPHLLVTTGYHDSQVQYWEPAKWVAKLREQNTSDRFILFKTDMDSGHSGTTGRFKSLELSALHYAFAAWVVTL